LQKSKLVFKDLDKEVGEFKELFSVFPKEDLFIIWFLKAYITNDDNEAAKSVVNGSNDKGIDAILIDHKSKAVFVIQGKYRQGINTANESKHDVTSFINLAQNLTTAKTREFNLFFQGAPADVMERLKQARRSLVREEYRLFMYYVTTGKYNKENVQQANRLLKQLAPQAIFEMFTGNKILHLLRDYLDGVAPPISLIDLKMERNRTASVMQRYDRVSEIESWVFPMDGNAIGSLYERYGIRLFARNIRGYLGDNTAVNQGMRKTLQTAPGRFFYYNNGVTILCDKAEKRSSRGRDVLTVSNPQIINGQQTTRTLASVGSSAKKASVLVKVIQVPRNTVDGQDAFDSLVAEIVKGTNWQNAIRPSDLISNDRTQIELEREFRRLGYLYLRKVQSKAEARRDVGKQYHIMKKNDIAIAVAGCNLDPIIARSGREKLFGESMYGTIFPNTDPNYYLPRYWLMIEVTYGAKGNPNWGYAKWVVMGFLWSKLSLLLSNKGKTEQFWKMCERENGELVDPLYAAIQLSYAAAHTYYRENRGTGSGALDVSQFYKNKHGRDVEFLRFWNRRDNKQRKKFNIYWDQLKRLF
jgi:hypothetical protein